MILFVHFNVMLTTKQLLDFTIMRNLSDPHGHCWAFLALVVVGCFGQVDSHIVENSHRPLEFLTFDSRKYFETFHMRFHKKRDNYICRIFWLVGTDKNRVWRKVGELQSEWYCTITWKKLGWCSYKFQIWLKMHVFNLVFEGDATVVYSLRHDFPEDRSGIHVRKLTFQKRDLKTLWGYGLSRGDIWK